MHTITLTFNSDKEYADFITNNVAFVSRMKFGEVKPAEEKPHYYQKKFAATWKRWTEDEDKYILENWGKISVKKMANYLNRTIGSVYTRRTYIIKKLDKMTAPVTQQKSPSGSWF